MPERRTWRRCDALCAARVECAGRLLLGAGDSQLRDLLPRCLPPSVLSAIEDFCDARIEEKEDAPDVGEDEAIWRLFANAPKTKRLGWRTDASPAACANVEEDW